jgi:anti-anti-sigma factor
MPHPPCGAAPWAVSSGRALPQRGSPASPLNLQIERTQTPRSLRLAGEVDLSNADSLSTALEPWLDTDGDVTLDLEGVVFMDSTGIGVLMRAAMKLASHGTLRLVSPGPLVYNVLTLIAAETLPNVEIVDPQPAPEEHPSRDGASDQPEEDPSDGGSARPTGVA